VDGAQRVRFQKPVITWVDNFLNFEVGMIVPVGYYDRDRGVWVPSDNGVVVKLLDTDTNGIVDALDADGDDLPDDLNNNGSFDDEVTGLNDAGKYIPDCTFWRVSLTHFTPCDMNWPPGYATPPNPKDGPSSGEEDPPCFVEGTLVKTNKGFEPIEKITTGDYVLSRDKITNDAVLRKVARTFVTPNKSIVELKFYNANGLVETIGATAGHPFWSKDRGWVAAANLQTDDKVYSFDNKWITFIGSEPLPSKRSVYNIEVEEFHTYFVGKSGLWVHNTCKTTIEPRKRIINESIFIPGTSMTLNYVSNRVDGYRYEITVPASGETVPSCLKSIIVKVEVAGRTLEQTLDPQPNQIAEFHWDGLDYLGRPSVSRAAHVKIGFVYNSYYMNPPEIFPAFAIGGSEITFITARRELVSWRDSNIYIEPMIKTRGGGLIADGWSFSSHHYLSPTDLSILLKGDGTKVKNNAWIINIVAGTGESGFSGDGGPAKEAQLYSPWDVTLDGEGNIYITDLGNHCIRKVDTNGFINTMAGTGESGFSGDGGPASEAQLDLPWDVAVDAKGNIYIADYGNNRIRKVDTSGIINTIAGTGVWGFSGDGGPASEAQLNSPTGVAVDAEGNIYISDYGNNRIRKVDTSGIINTIAGTGVWGFSGDGGPATEAQFNSLYRVAVDVRGNIYLTDYRNHRIRKVDTSGVINTVAGTGEMGFNGDGGPATEAQINSPKGVSVDASGNIYIADQGNNRIRKVDTSGIITTLAGCGEVGSGDGSPATEALLHYPWNVTVDAEGSIYIADTSDNCIRKVGTADTFSRVMTSDNIPFAEEYGIAHIMDSAGFHKKTIDLDTGVVLFDFGYDENNNLISSTDQFGNTITIQRTASGIPIAIVSADGISTGLTIDTDNHLTRITYLDGSHYDFQYTYDGLMAVKIEPEGNLFEHVFDTNGRLINAADEEGGNLQFTRTAYENGDILTEAITGEGNFTSYLDHTYSTGASISTITGPTGAETLLTRTDDGLTVNKILPCGMSFEFTYDVDREYGFKYAKKILESTTSSLEKVILRDKTYQDMNADGIPDLITETVTINDKSTTLKNNILQSQKTFTSSEGRTVTTLYDPATLVTESVSVPGLFDTIYGYDTRGRLISMDTNTRGTDFTYNAQGFLESVTDPEGYTTSYIYDAVGRVKQVDRPDSSSLWFSYDKNGNMTVLTNPSAINHGFGYNKVNLNSSYQTPLSGSYSYVYDKDRRLKQTNFPSGNQINNIYANGRLEQIQTNEGNIDFTYVCDTKVGSITNGTESINYGYDGKLVTSEALAGTLSQSLVYTYNNDFNLASLTYAGATTGFSYDNDGLLTGAGNFTITRNAGNGLPESVTGGALNLSRRFNGYGEVEAQDFTVSGQNPTSWTLTRDNNGRITQKTEAVDGITSHYDYTYDTMGRLLTVTKDGTLVEEYQYNLNGTRRYEMNALRDIAGKSFTYSDEDHLLTAGSATYQYNLDGFLTSKIDGADVTTYDYSSRGELLAVTLSDGPIIEYVHDPLGRRIVKKVDSVIVEKYLWQGLTRLLAVYDGTDNLLMRFEYADGRIPVAMTRGGVTYYLTYDQLSSLRVVADASGNVIKRIEYDSFGNIIDDTNTSFMVPFGFAGGLNDNDTGIVRFGYRNYDPDVGRWTAKDPIFLDGGETDFYGYCLNNPINAIDPLGLIVEADPFHPLPNIPTSNLTKGQKGALFKTGLGAGLIIGGSLTLPEGAPFIAVGIPMLAEGLTLDVVEFGFHGDTNDIPSTWEVFGTVAEQIYNLNNSCPVK
jgi:RHS repeat-associated protein